MRLELIDEFALGEDRAEAVRALLHASFPDAEFAATRTYLKQVPPRRLLAFEGERLIGHMGVEHRVIGTESGPATILGVVDLCVAAGARRRGVASRLLDHVDSLAARHGIDFLMLFATDRRLYERAGFRHQGNVLRWMMVHEHRIIGIDEQPLAELMIKTVADRPWPGGLIDLLGHQF